MMQHLTNDTLLDYVHGELSPAQDASVYTHIEQCESRLAKCCARRPRMTSANCPLP
jgi:anti-sigma factor RsiW